MTRRRALLIGSVAVVVALAVTVWVVWPRPSAINQENAGKIRKGMSLAEVEGILGGPARDESAGSGALHINTNTDGPDADMPWDNLAMLIVGGERVRSWRADPVMIRVLLDPGDRVVACRSFASRRGEESPLDTLRRWLGL